MRSELTIKNLEDAMSAVSSAMIQTPSDARKTKLRRIYDQLLQLRVHESDDLKTQLAASDK